MNLRALNPFRPAKTFTQLTSIASWQPVSEAPSRIFRTGCVLSLGYF
jgi:hypothetical protein